MGFSCLQTDILVHGINQVVVDQGSSGMALVGVACEVETFEGCLDAVDLLILRLKEFHIFICSFLHHVYLAIQVRFVRGDCSSEMQGDKFYTFWPASYVFYAF
ncbi:hypothetical protein NE237_014051 [Protea cynaroides]|uniref:Uncharacterized protein n=1 Tax=Protea cynaroides TaxID=273540 RepID=A0A9Q0H0F8_9MAGN|nr:hypothetical protein NE237_014051 [Protea cynaroides]